MSAPQLQKPQSPVRGVRVFMTRNLTRLKSIIINAGIRARAFPARILPRVKNIILVLGTFLVIVAGLVILPNLGLLGIAFSSPLLLLLLGAVYYLLTEHKTHHSIFSRMIEAVFPPVTTMRSWQEQLRQNRVVVDRMELVLSLYKLNNIDEAFRDELGKSLPIENTDTARIANCASNVSKRLQLTCPDLLVLLYQEQYSIITLDLWKRQRLKLIPALAGVLYKSGQLPAGRHGFSYDEHDLERVLRRLYDFVLKKVKADLKHVEDIWDIARRYVKFLQEHDIEFQECEGKLLRHDFTHSEVLPDETALLGIIDESELSVEPESLDETMLEFLIIMARMLISTKDGSLLTSFTLISLAIFPANNPAIKREAIRRLAEIDGAVEIVFAYLEFKEVLNIEEQLGGKEFVTLNYLIQNWKDKVEQKKRDLGSGFRKEIRSIRESLQEGDWLKRLPHVLERTFDTILKESAYPQSVQHLLKERPWLLESLKRVFQGLTLGTVERFLEARTVNAYLLTFRLDRGNIRSLLECLVSQQNKATLRGLGIVLEAGGRAKYNFEQYTHSARIGILPKGWSFDEFYRAFQEDFRKVIDNKETLVPDYNWKRNPLAGIEVIIHRFGLSGRNYYGFDSAITKKHAEERIKKLCADVLEPNDLIALIDYEDRVYLPEAMMEGSIKELVGSGVALEESEKNILEAQSESIRNAIVAAFRLRSIEDVGQHMLAASAQAREIGIRMVAGLIERRIDRLTPEQCESIAEVYLDTLAAIARIAPSSPNLPIQN